MLLICLARSLTGENNTQRYSGQAAHTVFFFKHILFGNSSWTNSQHLETVLECLIITNGLHWQMKFAQLTWICRFCAGQEQWWTLWWDKRSKVKSDNSANWQWRSCGITSSDEDHVILFKVAEFILIEKIICRKTTSSSRQKQTSHFLPVAVNFASWNVSCQ